MNPATHRMFWPSARAGSGPQLVCPSHRIRAIAIADALGFELTVVALAPPGVEVLLEEDDTP